MSRRFSGGRLEELRGRTTQTDLANALRLRGHGTTQTTVSRWESGQVPHSSVLPSLAAVLGCSVDDLFQDEAKSNGASADDDEESELVAHDLYAVLRRIVREEVRSAA